MLQLPVCWPVILKRFDLFLCNCHSVNEHLVLFRQKDSKGNLENALCAIDALPLGQYSSTGKQYGDHFLLRELNKAWVGFQQPWCTGEPAHTGSNRDSVVTSEEYYSAVEALNDEGTAIM